MLLQWWHVLINTNYLPLKYSAILALCDWVVWLLCWYLLHYMGFRTEPVAVSRTGTQYFGVETIISVLGKLLYKPPHINKYTVSLNEINTNRLLTCERPLRFTYTWGTRSLLCWLLGLGIVSGILWQPKILNWDTCLNYYNLKCVVYVCDYGGNIRE